MSLISLPLWSRLKYLSCHSYHNTHVVNVTEWSWSWLKETDVDCQQGTWNKQQSPVLNILLTHQSTETPSLRSVIIHLTYSFPPINVNIHPSGALSYPGEISAAAQMEQFKSLKVVMKETDCKCHSILDISWDCGHDKRAKMQSSGFTDKSSFCPSVIVTILQQQLKAAKTNNHDASS